MTLPTQATPSASAMLRSSTGGLPAELEPAFMRPERLVQPDSWAGHIPFAFWLTAAMRPRRYVELGVHTGNSYCAVAQTVARYDLGTECFGIDHWFGDEQAGLYGEDVYADLKAWHDPRYGHFSRLLRMSFEDGRAHVADGSVDILHIDGLHTYEAVRTDFETWQGKMSERCIVMFHDTNVHRSDFGVWQYWQEIAARYPTFEFLHSNGLGIAYTGTAPLASLPPAVAALFRASDDASSRNAIRETFDRLGAGFIQELRLSETRKHGEKILRELRTAYRDLTAIDQDRDRVVAETDALRARALKWDRLAVRSGGAIGLDLDRASTALDTLYNSDNPQARRDRAILQRQFSELTRTGTFEPRVKDMLLRGATRLSRAARARLRGRPELPEDPAIQAIRESGLFDVDYYALRDEARAAGQDALEHYLQTGEARRVAPSAGFDPEYYARRQADVAESGFGLLRHYVLFGRHEGRYPVGPAARLVIPALDTGRPRVLLVLRDAERNDATVQAWNIALQLKTDYDVVAFFQNGGALHGAFAQICAGVIDMPHDPGLQRADRLAVLARLAAELEPAFAVIASADARDCVRGLVAANVGVVQLVQDFASTIRPSGGVYDFLPFAHRLVFPADTVARSFRQEHPYLSQRRFDILPTGTTASPDAEGQPFGDEAFAGEVRRRLRPAGHEGAFLVVGIAEVSARKGTDLFVSLAAAATKAASSGRPLRFVWIGNGFDPDGPDAFSALLAEQIARTGVAAHLDILPDFESHDEIFRQADALALTARLDPLPNAAINALAAGVPVLCFDDASSLAERLTTAGSAAGALVSGYLDIPAMADRLLGLAADDTARIAAVEAIKQMTAQGFDGESYGAALVRLGIEAAEEAHAIARDHHTLASTSPFSADVFAGTWPADTHPQDQLQSYLLRWRVASSTGTMPPMGLRRPMAGFHPIIYAEDRLQGALKDEPFTHWLAAGRPAGRWTHEVIPLEPGLKPVAAPVKALLHGHFYYVDLIDDFLLRLNANASTIDLVLTVPDEAKAAIAREALSRHAPRGKAEVLVVGNIGRDIGPFISGLDHASLAAYDIIGHVHGKKSPHTDTATGEQWRNFLFEHLIGGRTSAADICLDAMARDARLGLIFPEDANLHGWDGNLALAEPLARRMGREAPLPHAFEWPIGNMFWARREALAPLIGLGLVWDDYPREPLGGDGTLLHALERLIPFAVEQAGFGYATTHLQEFQR